VAVGESEPRVPLLSQILLMVFRFVCGALVGTAVALLFALKVGGFVWWPISAAIVALFGLMAVVLWRWFWQIVDQVFNPIHWTRD
jgi:hypothetical protein